MTITLTDKLITTISIALTLTIKTYRQRVFLLEQKQQRAQGLAKLTDGYKKRASAIRVLTAAIDQNQEALDILAGLYTAVAAEQDTTVEGRC